MHWIAPSEKDTNNAALENASGMSDQHFPQIHFFDAKKNDAKSTESALVLLVLSLRKCRVAQIVEIAAAEEISKQREKAQARPLFEIVSRAIHSWAQARIGTEYPRATPAPRSINS